MDGTIIVGDALEAMEAMPDGAFKGVVTSPPYNVLNSTGGGLKHPGGGKWTASALMAGYDGHGDAMPRADYVEWQRGIVLQAWRLIADDGAIFYNHRQRVQGGRMEDPMEILGAFPVRQVIVWARKGGLNFNGGYFCPTHELIYLIPKPRFKVANGATRYGTVWDVAQDRNNAHPAPMPVEVARRCVEAIGGRVLDPFMGSGTTAVAANLHGLPWVGVEISARYAADARRRIEGDRRLF